MSNNTKFHPSASEMVRQRIKSCLLIGASAITCLISANTAGAANILSNPNFESGTSGWSTYSPVTWGNVGVNTDYSLSGSAFWARGGWAAQPNWMGCYQKAISAPGCGYQADAFIYSPSGYGTRGDQTVGDFGWIGIDGDQNFAWIEVSFRDGDNNILALYKSAVFNSTSPQSTWVESPVTNACDIYNGNTVTGAVTTLIAPEGTAWVQYQTVFEQANWGHGAVWFDNLALDQVSGPVPPSITGVTPDGAALFNKTAQNFTFETTSTTTDIDPGGIKVLVNGNDASSKLVITGSARDRVVSLPLKTNQVYSVSITVTDQNSFYTSGSYLFDTFDASSYIWEAEDYNFNGGQYFDSPVLSGVANTPNSYFGLATAINGVDFFDDGNNPSGNGDHSYRPTDVMNVGVATDIARANLTAAGVLDYKVDYFDANEWANYTRTFPSGKFNVWARVDGGSGTGIVDLFKVSGDMSTTNQTTEKLGTFTFNGRGWSTFDWVVLADKVGNPVAVDLGGLATLRATTRGGADLNFFMLVPAATDNPVLSNVYPNGATLFQPTNSLSFTASSPSTPIETNNITLTLNGTDVSSKLAFSGSSQSWNVTFPIQTNQTYTAVISVTDVNGNQTSSTVNFDTYSPKITVDAEDFDFDNGQFLDNAGANGYSGKLGALEVDEHGGLGEVANPYRPGDVMVTSPAGDTPRQAFVDNPSAVDEALGYFHAAEWVNYTRTIPAGNYNLYARVACGNASGSFTVGEVINGQGSSSQTVTNLGTCTVGLTGWSAYTYVPLRDSGGNLAEVSLSGVATFRFTSLADANINFFILVPARTDLPRISGLYPDGSTLLQGTNKLAFTASNLSVAIDSTNISVTLNGSNVSAQLTLTGSANNWNVSLPLRLNVTNYNAVIKVTDNNGSVATKTFSFDTFSATNFTFEAEDFDFNGGSYIDDPAVNAYKGLVGEYGIDEDDAGTSGNSTAAHDYRRNDYMGTQVCSDKTRAAIIAAQAIDSTVTDYNLAYWVTNSWVNYTHTYPTGNYQIWARLSGASTYHVQLANIVAGATNNLGTFSAADNSWTTWQYTPLKNSGGQIAVVALDGVSTLHVTTDGNANANFFMLVPYVAAPEATSMQVSLNGSSVVLSFPTQASFNYQVVYKNDLSDSTWTPLNAVTGDGTTKTATDSLGGSKRFYRLVIQ